MVGFAQSVHADEIGVSTTYFDSNLNYSPKNDAEIVANTDGDDLVEPANANPDRLLFKFGPGWSSVSNYGSPIAEKNFPRTAISLAGEYEHPLTAEFSLVTGLNYVQKGMDNAESSTSLRMNYLVIPILAKFNFQLGNHHRISFSVGPYVAYAPWAALYRENVSTGQFEPQYTDASRFDYGARFGLDYDFLIKSGFSFLIGGGYDLGFASISEGVINQSTRALTANIGVGIKI